MIRPRPIFILATLAFLTGCSQPRAQLPSPPSGTYRIYSSFPTSGQAAARSLEIVEAIDLAIAQMDTKATTIRLEHVKLTVPDAGSAEDMASSEVSNAQLASTDSSAMAYIGPYTSAGASSSLPVTNRAGLLQIGVSHTWPGLTETGWESDEPERYRVSGQRNYVRLARSDKLQAEAAAEWALDAGAQKVALVSDGSTYSNGMRTNFERELKAKGRSAAGSLSFSAETPAAIQNEIADLDADTVFYAPSTTQQAVAFARAMKSASLKVGIFATDTALNDQFAVNVPEEGNAWHIISNGATNLPSTPEAATFSKAFREAYGTEPGIFAAYAYDAATLVIKSLTSRSVVDRASVATDVLGTKDYQGASGPITFDDNGDVIGWTMPGYRLRYGLFVLERTLSSGP